MTVQAWSPQWFKYVADAHYRYCVRTGHIKPMKSSGGRTWIIVVGNGCKGSGKFNPALMRTLNAIITASGIRPTQRNRPNLQLHFDLAKWLLRQQKAGHTTPKRALQKFRDADLWQILQLHGQIRADATWWDSLTAEENDKLEKKLHQRWPMVARIADALSAPTRRATNSRRKPLKPMQLAVSQLMKATKT